MSSAPVAAGVLAGIGLTRLQVYEQRPAPDGVMSGCAHVHAYTDEGYYAVAGIGAVELNDLEHGFRRVPLAPGEYVQFPPGTLHRSVSTGGLQVLVLMGNAGLAEHGDARIYFGPEVDAAPEEYARLAGLPRARGLDGALERRDASVRAYVKLLALWRDDRPAYFRELARFIDCHRRATADRREAFTTAVREGPARWSDRALALLSGTPPAPGAIAATPADATRVLGMCGQLEQLITTRPV